MPILRHNGLNREKGRALKPVKGSVKNGAGNFHAVCVEVLQKERKYLFCFPAGYDTIKPIKGEYEYGTGNGNQRDQRNSQ